MQSGAIFALMPLLLVVFYTLRDVRAEHLRRGLEISGAPDVADAYVKIAVHLTHRVVRRRRRGLGVGRRANTLEDTALHEQSLFLSLPLISHSIA